LTAGDNERMMPMPPPESSKAPDLELTLETGALSCTQLTIEDLLQELIDHPEMGRDDTPVVKPPRRRRATRGD
jgi:hypothetical protein